jgi:hypothetical protein
MNRRPSPASASPVGRVTLTLYGPIGELAATLRTLADALDHEQATSTVTYTATVEPQARGPAPGGMTARLADRFVARLTPAAVEVLVVLCRRAPELTYEKFQAEVQAQLGIGRDRLGGVLTSLAGARKRLPRDVDYPIKRDKDLRRYRIEPVAAELLLAAVERARAAGLITGPGSADALPAGQTGARLDGRLQDQPGVDLDA